MKKEFLVSIFIDDGNELETIIEDTVIAEDESSAASELLSLESHTFIFWKKQNWRL